jgi:protein-tyrosine-phosphatase
MATELAKRENNRRNTNVRILTGGTQPAEHVHPEVVEVMDEKGIDLNDREPRKIQPEELHSCELVITMGCSARDVCPTNYVGESRDWDLEDPDGKDLDEVRDIRDDINRRLTVLFDELEEEYDVR